MHKITICICCLLSACIYPFVALAQGSGLSPSAVVISRVSYEYKKPKRSDVREQNHLYNDDGKLAQLTTIYGFGKTIHETYTYNDQAQLITRNIVVNGADTSTIHYEYNSDGTIAKLTEHYPNETQDNRFYRYSESGLLIHSSFTVNGQEVENYTY